MRCIHFHAAEFMQLKILFIFSDAFLSKKGRSRVIYFNCDHQQYIQPGKSRQSAEGKQDINQSLEIVLVHRLSRTFPFSVTAVCRISDGLRASDRFASLSRKARSCLFPKIPFFDNSKQMPGVSYIMRHKSKKILFPRLRCGNISSKPSLQRRPEHFFIFHPKTCGFSPLYHNAEDISTAKYTVLTASAAACCVRV